jgi:LmbE family N-acetylglucosaminyl deacetylase
MTTSDRVLVVLAHPDDPEFFCGGTIARWAASGRDITYCLLTRGDKGSDDERFVKANSGLLRKPWGCMM